MEDDCMLVLRVEMRLSNLGYVCIPFIADSEYKKKIIFLFLSCKAQRNLNSFFAIVMGLNTASVSRLSQTWEVRHIFISFRHCQNHFAQRLYTGELPFLSDYCFFMLKSNMEGMLVEKILYDLKP